jgi:hypothetical protein
MFHHDSLRTGLATGSSVSSDPGRLINLSVLSAVGPGNQLLTLGFVTGGLNTSGAQSLLLRGTGPALTAFGVSPVLADPVLTLFSGQAVVAQNDNWGSPSSNAQAVTATDQMVYAFPLTEKGSLDAGLVISLSNPSGYTVQITGNNNGSGFALAEVYDATPAATYTPSVPRLINLSSQTNLSASSSMTAGFIVGGSTSETVLIRAAGPALANLGVTGVMPDPQLKVFDSNANLIAANAGWGGNPLIAYDSNAVFAFPFSNPSSADSAVLLTLAPGAYTAQVSSVSGSGGAALVEVYEVP